MTRHRRDALVAAVACACLLAGFSGASAWAIRGKSSTYDEPLHTLAAWVHLHRADWRIDYEDPPLWQYWAALPHGANAIDADFDSPRWQRVATSWKEQWPWTIDTLYRGTNDGEAFVRRSRSMMIVLGAALGAAIAWWGWQIGGVATAIAGTVLFAFDPNFLGHAALVKNDVATALCWLLLTLAIWCVGRRLTVWTVAGAAAACAAAMTTKFSGVMLAPLVATLLLAVRVAMPTPWPVGGRVLVNPWQRALVATACLVAIAAGSAAGIWAAYGGRFAAMPDPSLRLDRAYILDEARRNQVRASFGNDVPNGPELSDDVARRVEERMAAWAPDPALRVLGWMLDRRLFPEAWLAGLMFVHARSQIRWSYLDGELSIVGFRRYFPLAMLYKTPLATLVAFGAAAVVGMWLARSWESMWLASCLLLPPALELGVAIGSNLDIGLRHVLPAYPPLFLATAWAFSGAIARAGRGAVVAGALLALGLGVESVASAPDYLAFFNAAAGGERGGIRRLGDSNLDWGQDLPLVAEWQRRHPGVRLYLAYFGIVPPEVYGIAYENLPGGYRFGGPSVVPRDGDGVVAISASMLQCLYVDEESKPFYRGFGGRAPTAVLGGSIYLYDLGAPSPGSGPIPCGRIASDAASSSAAR